MKIILFSVLIQFSLVASGSEYIGGYYSMAEYPTLAEEVVVDSSGDLLLYKNATHPIRKEYVGVTDGYRKPERFVRQAHIPGFFYINELWLNSSNYGTPEDGKFKSGQYIELLSDSSLVISDIQFIDSFEYGYTKPGVIKSKKIERRLYFVARPQLVIAELFKFRSYANDKYLKYESNCKIASKHATDRVLTDCLTLYDLSACKASLVTESEAYGTYSNFCSVSATIRIKNN